MPRHDSATRYALQVISVTLLSSAWCFAQPQPANRAEATASAAPGAPASSPAERDAARGHAAAAFTALDEARYDAAIAEFTLALSLMDVPTLRVGRADALVHANRWLEAHADYEAAINYVIQPGDSEAFAQSQKDASTKLEGLRSRMPRLRIDADVASVQVEVDDGPSFVVEAGQTIALDPGSHRVVVVGPGGSFTHTVQTREGETSVIAANTKTASDVVAPAVDAAAVGEEPDQPNTALVVSGSITAVLAAGAVATGVWWLVERSDFSNEDASHEQKVRDHRHLETLAWVNTGLSAAAVAAAGVTAYLWLSPQFEPQPDVSSSAAPSGLPRGVSLMASGHF